MGKKNRISITHLIQLATIALVFGLTACAGTNSPLNWNQGPHALADDKIHLFKSSIRAERKDPKLLYQQAYYFLANKKFKVAAALLQDLVTIDPKNVYAHNALGVAYDYLGEQNLAIESYQNALLIDPQLDFVWNNIGYSYMIKNDYDSALKAYKKAIELDNKQPKFHNNLAVVYAKKENYPLAFLEFCAGGGALRAHYNLAKIYYNKGQYDKAQKHFAKVLKIDSEDKRSKNGYMASFALLDISNHNSAAPILDRKKAIEDSSKFDNSKIMLPGENHSKYKMSNVMNTGNKAHRIKTKSASIEISNGNGIEGMAKRVKDYFNTNGYQNISVSNAKHFNYNKTIIFYEKNYLHTAYQIAKQIPGMQNMEKVDAADNHGVKVKILLGKDMVAYEKYFSSTMKVAKW